MARTSPPTGILSADGFKSYTSFAADITLDDGGLGATAATTGLAGYKHCAGTIIAENNTGPAGTLVLMDHSGNTATFPVPIASVVVIEASAQKIVASGTANVALVVALWWASDRL